MKRANVFSYVTIFCLTTSAVAATLEFDADTRVKKMDADRSEIAKAGSKLDIPDGDALLVMADGMVPMLVVSPSRTSNLKMNAVQVRSFEDHYLAPVLDRRLNEVINEVNRVQSFIQKRDYNNAGTQVKVLQEKYPRLATIHFLSATINFLSNNKTMAREDVKRGLAIDPENESAKRLLEKLGAE